MKTRIERFADFVESRQLVIGSVAVISIAAMICVPAALHLVDRLHAVTYILGGR